MGDLSHAMNELKRAFSSGFNNIDHIEKDSDLANLHRHPEFLRLIQKN